MKINVSTLYNYNINFYNSKWTKKSVAFLILSIPFSSHARIYIYVNKFMKWKKMKSVNWIYPTISPLHNCTVTDLTWHMSHAVMSTSQVWQKPELSIFKNIFAKSLPAVRREIIKFKFKEREKFKDTTKFP